MNPAESDEIVISNIFHDFFLLFRITWIWRRRRKKPPAEIEESVQPMARSYLVHHFVLEWQYVWLHIDYYRSMQSNLIRKKNSLFFFGRTHSISSKNSACFDVLTCKAIHSIEIIKSLWSANLYYVEQLEEISV